jgi:ATP-dependent DNA helicase RecG
LSTNQGGPDGNRVPSDLISIRSSAVTITGLAEALVALANGRGGTLYIGLDPPAQQSPEPEAPPDMLDKALQAALAIEPPLIIPLPQLIEREGQQFLAISVPPGLPRVYGYKGKYLIRDGSHNRPLNPQRLRRLIMERGTASFELLVPDGARLDDIDWGKAERYTSNLEGLPSASCRDVLLQRGCLREEAGELFPTHAGVLLFGRDPQRWIRSSRILLARYAGRTMEDSFVREEIGGSLPEQIRRAEGFVVSNLERSVRLVGLERLEEIEYPVEAVREAIVNAVAHRDYQTGGDGIRILLYADRLEFHSPGRLPGHVTVKNIVQERFSRNEIIVQVLSDLGYIERLGYGIDRMIRLMAEAGLPPPRFEETPAGFRVTLQGRRGTLLSAEAEIHRWRHLGLNERQEKALDYLANRGRITNRELQDLCPDVSAETIRRDLADLVSRNLLLKIGEKRATYYILK